MSTNEEHDPESGAAFDLHRQARQRLESLRRAGVDRVLKPGASHTMRNMTPEPAETPRAEPEKPRPAPPTPASIAAATPSRSLFEPNAADLGPVVPPEERDAALAVIAGEVAGCPRCPELASTRNRTVFGEGSPTARLMFIGEAPGADEDRTGRPFVGRAGQLLTDMITKGMGLAREDVFIANVLKCRPPGNRTPHAEEVANCRGYLERQLQIIRPEFLCLLGKTAAAALLDVGTQPMGKLRGHWFEVEGIRTLITYHPAYLLRNPASKRETWADLQLLMAELGLPNPLRGDD